MTDAAPEADYAAFARQLIDAGVITDPWLDGAPRFGLVPEVVSPAFARSLLRAGERLAAAYNELCLLVDDEPALLDSFFGLSPVQKLMWQASAPLWHGLARADLFVTDEGLVTTELNSDTPTGEAEAVELGRLVGAAHPHLSDPNARLKGRFLAMAEALTRRWVGDDAPRVAALVYPTEFTEDLSLVRLYRGWLEDDGWEVVLGSPYNLGRDGDDGPATVFDTPVSLVVRHYKTDWWGEREGVFTDDDVLDAEPLIDPLRALLGAFVDRRTAVLNPFGAVVPQNKRAMAFMWEHLHRFTADAQATIRDLVPHTRRLESVHEAQLVAQRPLWVLKSDYGAEGDEVVLGRDVTDAEWQRCLAHARPGRWIAQRYFEAQRDARGEVINWGVFVVAGEGAGLYARRSAGATDDTARSVATLVDDAAR